MHVCVRACVFVCAYDVGIEASGDSVRLVAITVVGPLKA